MGTSIFSSKLIHADGKRNFKDQLTLNQAHHLTKAEIISELKKRGHEVEESATRDLLRSQLVNTVRAEVTNSRSPREDEPKQETPQGQGRSNENIPENTGGSSSAAGQNYKQGHIEAGRSTNSSSDESSIADTTKILFQLKSDDWDAFLERIELYFVVKKIQDDTMKVATLLTYLDEEAYILLRNLCTPAKPATKGFVELAKLMSDHLSPAPSEVMERCKFNSARQEANESVAEFAANYHYIVIFQT